jgi:hypothetical protein
VLGSYHGQFAFLGRLEHQVAPIPPYQATEWLAGDSRRRLVVELPDPGSGSIRAEYAQRYRGQALAILDESNWGDYRALTRAGTWSAWPGLHPNAPPPAGDADVHPPERSS